MKDSFFGSCHKDTAGHTHAHLHIGPGTGDIRNLEWNAEGELIYDSHPEMGYHPKPDWESIEKARAEVKSGGGITFEVSDLASLEALKKRLRRET